MNTVISIISIYIMISGLKLSNPSYGVETILPFEKSNFYKVILIFEQWLVSSLVEI